MNSIAFAILSMAVLGTSCNKKTVENAEQSTNVEDTSVVAVDTVVTAQMTESVSNSSFPVAYVNVAQLQESLQKFDFYKKWNEKLLQKEAKSTKELKDAQKVLAAELEVFQQKYKAGGFLTQESLEQEQARLYKKEQDLQQLQMRLEQEFANEQIKLTKQLMDTIDTFFKVYNADGKYKLILNRADVLFADEAMDITPDVLNQMNARYTTKKK